MTSMHGILPHAISQALTKAISASEDKSTRRSPSPLFFWFKYNHCSKSNRTGLMFMKVDRTLYIGLSA